LLETQGSDVGFDNHDAKIAFLATVGRCKSASDVG
jgi:hypothetical protein